MIFDNNPIMVCECGRKYRQFGIGRNGEKRTYTECMQCHIDNYMARMAESKTGYASTKDATESEDINF